MERQARNMMDRCQVGWIIVHRPSRSTLLHQHTSFSQNSCLSCIEICKSFYSLMLSPNVRGAGWVLIRTLAALKRVARLLAGAVWDIRSNGMWRPLRTAKNDPELFGLPSYEIESEASFSIHWRTIDSSWRRRRCVGNSCHSKSNKARRNRIKSKKVLFGVTDFGHLSCAVI